MSQAYTPGAKIKDLSAEFGRNPGAIRSRLKKLGLIQPATESTPEAM